MKVEDIMNCIGVDSVSVLEDKCSLSSIFSKNNSVDMYRLMILHEQEKINKKDLAEFGIKNRDAIWILENSVFISNYLKKIFIDKEGLSCSSDKARTVINALFKYYAFNQEIIFNYDSEFTFHLPKKVLMSQNDICDFFVAVMNIYYGNLQPYEDFLARYDFNEDDMILVSGGS